MTTVTTASQRKISFVKSSISSHNFYHTNHSHLNPPNGIGFLLANRSIAESRALGVVQLVGHDLLDLLRQALLQRLRHLGVAGGVRNLACWDVLVKKRNTRFGGKPVGSLAGTYRCEGCCRCRGRRRGACLRRTWGPCPGLCRGRRTGLRARRLGPFRW